jgi:hypothetical protein
VRNPVAHSSVHRVQGLTVRVTRVAAVLALLPAAFVLVATASAGADTGVAAEQGSFGVAGPVGIGAVILGVGGLVVGLVRRHRTKAARVALIETRPMAAVPAAHTETVA